MSPNDHDTDRMPAIDQPTLSQVLRMLRSIHDGLDEIKRQLAEGSVTIAAVKELPERVTRLEETVQTLRTLVYGAVGLMMTGLLMTVGGAILWVLRKGSGP